MAFIVVASVSYAFKDVIVPFLMQPLHGEKLIYLNPAGGFSFIFLVSVYAGIALTLPLLFHQVYAFLRPALPASTQKLSARIAIYSFLLLFAGVAFGYYVAVPNALTFLYGFAGQYVQASLTADSYLSFITAYTLGVGIVFQLPLLLLLIHRIKPLSPSGLLKSEKWVILIAFILAAIITPTPDPINQLIIALPIVAVYQLGVVAILFAIYKKWRRQQNVKLVATIKPKPPIHSVIGNQNLTSAPPAIKSPAPALRSIDGFTTIKSSTLPKQSHYQHQNTQVRQVAQSPKRPSLYIDGIYSVKPAANASL